MGFLLLALGAGAVSAAELIGLGDGLAYLDIPSVAATEKVLRSAVPGAGAIVLDLRQVAATDESLDALRAAVARRADGAPLFVLVSPATPPAVAGVLRQAAPFAITLGVAGSVPEPQVVVKTDAASDRRAHAALVAGTPVATLITGKVAKERYDEAVLVKEFKNGNPDPAPPEPPEPAAGAPDPGQSGPVDRVLQRAVHLHRALAALRR